MVWEEGVLPERSERFSASENIAHVPYFLDYYRKAYHATQTAALTLGRAVLGQLPVVVPVGLDWQTVCAQRGEGHPERCPTCGQRLVCTGVIPRGGAPPRIASGECAA